MRATALIVGALLLLHGVRATAELPVAGEYQVKAAFLYNFGRFVEWPPEAFAQPTAPLRVCVVGSDPFGADLDEVIQGKTIGEHKLLVLRLARAEQATQCHIAFLGGAESADLDRSLAALRSSSALTVGESADFLQAGGMILFTIRDNKVHFSVNLNAASEAGIKISSKLLKLADFVVGQPGARR